MSVYACIRHPGEGVPVILVLDDPLVPLQLVLKRCLVHGQVATFTGELL